MSAKNTKKTDQQEPTISPTTPMALNPMAPKNIRYHYNSDPFPPSEDGGCLDLPFGHDVYCNRKADMESSLRKKEDYQPSEREKYRKKLEKIFKDQDKTLKE